MWQIFSLLSIVSSAVEVVVDKAVMVRGKTVDIIGATWFRNLILVGVTFLGGWLFEGHIPHIFLSVPIILLGLLYAGQALLYTTALRHIEITASSLVENFIPLVFLPIDIFIIGAPFLPRQIAGVIAMVAGGVLFFFKHKGITKRHIQFVAGIFLFDALVFGLEGYSFQSVFAANTASAGDFLWSMSSVMLLALSAVFVGACLYQWEIPSFNSYGSYARGSLLAKTIGYLESFFFLQAVALVSISRVAAMNALYPLILIALVIITQKRFNIDLEELLDRKTIFQKIVASILVCIGIYLIR